MNADDLEQELNRLDKIEKNKTLDDFIFQIVNLKKDENVQNFLKELGFDQIGNDSSYAKVYKKGNKDWVVKVSFDDLAYEYFVDFIKQNPNKHYPVVTNILSKKFNKKLINVYIIEKLVEFPYYGRGSIQDRIYRSSLEYKSNFKGPDKEIVEFLEIEYPELAEAIKKLVITSNNNKQFRVDMHPGNIMLRLKDRTIVLIDPLAPKLKET